MNDIEIKKRLQIYEAIVTQHMEPVSDGNKILVFPLVGDKIREVDINREIEWIAQQLKDLKEEHFRRMGWWIDAAPGNPSREDFKKAALQVQQWIELLEGYEQYFVWMKEAQLSKVSGQTMKKAKTEKARRGAMMPQDATRELNEQIRNEANDLHDRGNTWPEVYEMLSEHSKEKFGQELTPGALRGRKDRGNRTKGRHR